MSKLWGGRFSKATSEDVDQFNASIGFDSRLWEFDIEGSMAHATMLGECGVIPAEDAQSILEGLKTIEADIRAGKVEFDISAEDVHMNIEKLLHERIGPVAGRLHTARSRNDQVALDMRMYVRAQIKLLGAALRNVQKTLVDTAEKHLDDVIPGYTHLQHAQPVPLAHHLLAYVWMFQRDRERFEDCYTRTDVMPLGSGAMAGTSFPLNRHRVAELLGFSKVSENSMDGVSTRDFAAEFLSACAIASMHMSRFAEEMIIWNSREFGFVELDDSMATGSSLMPQKKNPDVPELIRAKTGRVYGDLMALLTVLKGLPLTYNKDLQEDKEPVFDAADAVAVCLKMLDLLIGSTTFNTERMKQSLKGDFSNAVDLADYLVRRGVPFRAAHEVVGRIVAYCIEQGKTFEDLTLDELKRFSDQFESTDAVSSIESSVSARNVCGSTGKERILEQLEAAKKVLAQDSP
jgi:argininosuccinate lyase